jgi:hypothetical protein
VVLALDFLAASSWFGPYFRFGIPLYIRRTGFRRVAASPAPEALQQALQGRPNMPHLRFKFITPGLMAFREAFFEGGNGIRYLPVMHSAAQVDAGDGRVALTGYMNWYVLFTLIYMVLRSLDDSSFILVAVLVLFVFGLSYFAQWGINQAVAEALEHAPGAAP